MDWTKLRLQKFGYKDSRYERPSHKWICGRLSEGRPCAVGPDEGGGCNASVECFPLREGDRWNCTRDQLRGGKCADGPLPDGSCSRSVPQCLPVLSLRNKRGLLSRWLCVLSFAGILIILNSPPPDRLNFLSPGQLSLQHGSFNNPCENCHSASTESPSTWITSTVLFPHDKTKENGLCIKCHNFGDHALTAHTIVPQALSDIRLEIKSRDDRNVKLSFPSLLSFAPATTQRNDQLLSCGSCHREHKGQQANLKVISDQQCQTCHIKQFDRFSAGHPEISGFSFHRRPRIRFNHQSHKGKHYPDEKLYPGGREEFSCPNCHRVEANGKKMLSPNFDEGCRNCHIAEIEGWGSADEIGLPVISVPGLDIETLREHKIPVGEWPEFAESKLTPFMTTLLSSDPAFKDAGPGLSRIDLLDLRSASKDEFKAVQSLAWAVKKLLNELNNGGHAALVARLKKIFGEALDEAAISLIVGGLPADTVAGAQQQWFPNLASEIAQFDTGSLPPARVATIKKNLDEAKAPDNMGANTSSETNNELVEFDLSAIEVDVDDLSSIEVTEPADEQLEADSEEKKPASGENWVQFGGWYHQDFKLSYRPGGHADGFVKLWLVSTALRAGGPSNPEAELFKKTLADPKAPGKCMKCHSIDQQDPAGLQINWYGLKPDAEKHEFTSFSHQPHFSLIESKGCITCHAWNQNTNYDFSASYQQYNPLSYTSNFAQLSKQVCTECHTKNAAGESCLTCHNYHVGKFPNLMHTITTQ